MRCAQCSAPGEPSSCTSSAPMRSSRRWDKSVKSSSESSGLFKCVWISLNPLKRSEEDRNPSRFGINIPLWSPIMTVVISPLRLISRPIWRLISRERKDSCRARSWLMIVSGGIPLWPRRSICLIWAAPSPAVFPNILLIAVFPVHFANIYPPQVDKIIASRFTLI